ncbi:MAG: thioredoxin family protein [Neptunomonas phycophila]|uniref:thioredoxin family protein n=1 Tax=Neptunomonas phycophila TaxID=1572645 RepID=UPI003B8DF103
MSQIVEVNSNEDFESKVVGAKGKQLVKFTASWCGPCKMMKPIDEGIAADGDVEVVYVNIDSAEDIAPKFGVRGVPTYFVFEDGVKSDKAPLVGAKSKGDMTSFIA